MEVHSPPGESIFCDIRVVWTVGCVLRVSQCKVHYPNMGGESFKQVDVGYQTKQTVLLDILSTKRAFHTKDSFIFFTNRQTNTV